MSADRYWKTLLQLQFRNNLEITRIVVEILKISSIAKYYNSVGTSFPSPIRCRILRGVVTHSFEVIHSYFSEILGGLPPLLMTAVDVTYLLYNKFTARRNTIYCKGKIRGRVMAQAPGRRVLAPEVRVRARISPCGVCGRQSGTDRGFLLFLFFTVSVILPTHHTLISSGDKSKLQICDILSPSST
jgi:hypothetical protein